MLTARPFDAAVARRGLKTNSEGSATHAWGECMPSTYRESASQDELRTGKRVVGSFIVALVEAAEAKPARRGPYKKVKDVNFSLEI